MDYFLATVILANGGTVTIYSLNGHVLFYRSSGVIASRVLSTKGYCPGTVIDISLRTDTIEHLDDEPEDLEW